MACGEGPCVDVKLRGPGSACVGTTIRLEAKASNCGEGPAEMIARMCIPGERGWVLEAELYASPLSGRFLLLPDEPGLMTFLRGLKMA